MCTGLRLQPTPGLEPDSFGRRLPAGSLRTPPPASGGFRAASSSLLVGAGFGTRFKNPCFKRQRPGHFCARVYVYSQLPDLNRVPARYEGAALPGELSWHFCALMMSVFWKKIKGFCWDCKHLGWRTMGLVAPIGTTAKPF